MTILTVVLKHGVDFGMFCYGFVSILHFKDSVISHLKVLLAQRTLRLFLVAYWNKQHISSKVQDVDINYFFTLRSL